MGGLQVRRERWVRPGIGHMNLLHLNVAADGTVEMLKSEVEAFLRVRWLRIDAGDLRG